jgi:peptidoglycan/LPS O-acetylase OafA/YrhL
LADLVSKKAPRGGIKHLYLLDILRGLASLSVVLWHYQHFYFVAPGKLAAGYLRSWEPLYSLLWPFYLYGDDAVALFFVLSGFVFYYTYSTAIPDKLVSPYKFFILRFSRLYPLHFATLIIVAVVQLDASASLGSFIVYPSNNLRNFVLNLFFASDWGFQRGLSFNSPVWSVSVEVLLYGLFFLVTLAMAKKVFPAIAFVIFGFLMTCSPSGSFRDIGLGIYCFFSGGIAFIVFDRFRHSTHLSPCLAAAAIFICNIIIIVILNIIFPRFSNTIFRLFVLIPGCFSSLVLLLATLQLEWSTLGRPVKLIGDITYSTYLLHFPIQLIIIWGAARSGATINFGNPAILLLYVGIVIGLSIPCYYLFELPARSFLRRRLMRPAAATVGSAVSR